MNYLAHGLLSGRDPELVIGNLIADVVRIYNASDLSPRVRAGIRLHQRIDQFTDEHPCFRRSVSRIWPQHRHYSTALVDIFYDHLLARNFDRFSGDESLEAFSGRVNDILQNTREAIPPVFFQRARDMSWLTGYAAMDGIRQSLQRLSRRSRYGVDFTPAAQDLEDRYDEFEGDFLEFFPEAVEFAAFCRETQPALAGSS